MSELNPLLDFSGFPQFDKILPQHVSPAVDTLISQGNEFIDSLGQNGDSPTWNNFAVPLFDCTEKLNRMWGNVNHLNSVMNNPELRDAYNANLAKISEFWTSLGQNEVLMQKYLALKNSDEYSKLTPTQQRIVDNEIRDFKLGGALLPEAQKNRFKEIQAELSQLSAKFAENVLDATNDYKLIIKNFDDLAGLPADVIETAKQTALSENLTDAWVFTLQAPSYLAFMKYADNRKLREELYRAYFTRASEFGKEEWNNSPLITQILILREELAKILEFPNYAEYSIETKMAESATKVKEFLRSLAEKAKPYAQKDIEELTDFAKATANISDLQPWDMAYFSEKLRVARYDFSDHELKQYFPEDAVLKGLFNLIETMFQVKIQQEQASVWHSDAKFFTITKQADNSIIGHFYLDLYARSSKRGGAWMDEVITRKKNMDNQIQKPVAHLVCNFPAPVGNQPALFTHSDVITLFHEFGHGLHHLMTRIDDLVVSGIHGVEWDAVELPSQFMENFCWEWNVLSSMTRHSQTGESLPRAFYDKMIEAKNFQSGMATVRQLEFSLVDILLHSEYNPKGEQTPLDVLNAVRQEVAVIFPPEYHRFLNNFTHIFAGGYSAGYYSYKWAEVLSADVFAKFEEDGIDNPAVGKAFLDEILSVGGSRPAMESFKAFRGREPSIEPLLRHCGMNS